MNLRQFLLQVIFSAGTLLSLSCDKLVSVTSEDHPVPTGFIYIESNPTGAAIFINGKNTGRITPDSIRWLEDNMYKITLRLKYFRDTVFYAKAEQNIKNKLSIDYLSNPMMYGSIACASKPNLALIKINGTVTGKQTPYTFDNLKPGIYSVGYQAFGCREDSQYVTVESNKTASCFIELTDTTVWVNYNSFNSPLKAQYLTCITIDNDDVKWIGTDREGLIRFNDVEWKTFTPKNSPLPSYGINCLKMEYSYSKSGLWIGTSDGLAFYNGIEWKVFRTDNSLLPDNFINAINIDLSNNIWIGTNKGLVKISSAGKWTIERQSGIISKIDFSQGKVWAGLVSTGKGWMLCYDYSKWTSIELPLPIVSALSAGYTYGGIWVSYCDFDESAGRPIGYIGVYENDGLATIKNIPVTQYDCIVLHDAIRWAGSFEGLIKFSNTTPVETFTKSNSGLPENRIKDIAFDSNGRMWIVMFTGGLVKYKIK